MTKPRDPELLPPGIIPPAEHDRAIKWMNSQHAIVFDGSKFLVWTQQENLALGRLEWRQSTAGDLKAFYSRHIVVFDDRRREPMSLGKFWISHQDARAFRDVVFDPTTPHTTALNLWQGYTVEPKAGKWDRFKEHLQTVIAGGFEERYEYLLGWLAYMLQNPLDPIGSAVVLRGDPGAGKGLVARSVGKLLGDHFVHIQHSSQLTSKFNGFLANALLVFADESFFAGDRSAEGALKAMITEPTIQIQRKGREYVTMRNCAHLIMAANEDWVVPVRMKDRRFFVLDVQSKRPEDYYTKILKEQSNGGARAMLHDLLAMDLSNFNPRRIPVTLAKENQFILSMNPIERWWFDGLLYRTIANQRWEHAPRIDRNDLYKHYIDVVMKQWGGSHPLSQGQFGKVLKRFLPEIDTIKGTSSLRSYLLPSVEQARENFQRYAGYEFSWLADDSVDHEPALVG